MQAQEQVVLSGPLSLTAWSIVSVFLGLIVSLDLPPSSVLYLRLCLCVIELLYSDIRNLLIGGVFSLLFIYIYPILTLVYFIRTLFRDFRFVFIFVAGALSTFSLLCIPFVCIL